MHRLKGLSDPDHVHQLLDTDTTDVKPVRSPSATTTNRDSEAPDLIDREEEIAAAMTCWVRTGWSR